MPLTPLSTKVCEYCWNAIHFATIHCATVCVVYSRAGFSPPAAAGTLGNGTLTVHTTLSPSDNPACYQGANFSQLLCGQAESGCRIAQKLSPKLRVPHEADHCGRGGFVDIDRN